jgi:flagellar basal body-associated protein FliL
MLEYAWALLSSFVVTLLEKVPSARVRRATSRWIPVLVVIIIMLCGALLIIYFVAIGPGSTSTYP